MPARFVLKFTGCLVLALSLSSIAQQKTPVADSPTQQAQDTGMKSASEQPAPQPQTEQKSDKNSGEDPHKGKIAGTSNDRLFFALPNFLSLQGAGSLPPLTVKQKFGVVAQSVLERGQGFFDPRIVENLQTAIRKRHIEVNAYEDVLVV